MSVQWQEADLGSLGGKTAPEVEGPQAWVPGLSEPSPARAETWGWGVAHGAPP